MNTKGIKNALLDIFQKKKKKYQQILEFKKEFVQKWYTHLLLLTVTEMNKQNQIKQKWINRNGAMA